MDFRDATLVLRPRGNVRQMDRSLAFAAPIRASNVREGLCIENRMDKVRRSLAVGAVAGLAAFTLWITWLAKGLESQQPGGTQARLLMRQPAPELLLKSLDGRPVSLSEFKGQKKVVVSFWSSSSRPCRMELAALRSLQTPG